MTPGERVVVEAAIAYYWHNHESVDFHNNLFYAVEALLAERTADEPTEQELTYGQVVAGDEIFNAKVQKWYFVTRTALLITGMMSITVRNVPKPFERDHMGSVRVRRGPDGKACDVLASVMWSMTTRAGEVAQ